MASAVAAPQQAPRDRRPGEPAPETLQERQLKQAIEANPSNRELYFSLAGLQQARGAMREFEATLAAARRAFPNEIATLTLIARAYLRIGRFDEAMVALQEAAALDPANPASHHLIAVHYWEKAYKDPRLAPAQKLAYVHAGIAAADRALAQDPDYVDSLVYKNILLRMEANLDPVNAASLLVQADALRDRALELQRARGPQRGVAGGVPGGVRGGVPGGVAVGRRSEMEFVPAPGAPPPPPPPPPPPGAMEVAPENPPLPAQVDGMTPLRIGGNIRPPTKIRDVKPAYPPIAQSARVQGVVIIEALINSIGDVVHARVLRGQPLLDQAAIEAVQQWQFTPTVVKGVPTPVIMTVTVNFVLE
jgi:TonB family protein